MKIASKDTGEYRDRAYWDQPRWLRIYMRVFYAITAFIITSSLFDVLTPAPIWFQIALGASVSVATLMFRIAYPDGFSNIYEWILEGMQEAAQEMEGKGATPKMSSEEITDMLEQYRSEDGRQEFLKQSRKKYQDQLKHKRK